MYNSQGRHRGVCLGRAKCLATAAPAMKMTLSGGGGGGGGGGGDSNTTFFFQTCKFYPRNCHNGVEVLSSPQHD